MSEELDRYLNSAEVCRRYGDISNMTLFRWLQDERMNFPRPLLLNRRRFWKVSDLEAFERGRIAA